MAARELHSNFWMKFGGFAWNNIWNGLVVVVIKVEGFCKNSKCM
jgi:hypothetical protein